MKLVRNRATPDNNGPKHRSRVFICDDKFVDIRKGLLQRGWSSNPVLGSPAYDFKWRNYCKINFRLLRSTQASHYALHVWQQLIEVLNCTFLYPLPCVCRSLIIYSTPSISPARPWWPVTCRVRNGFAHVAFSRVPGSPSVLHISSAFSTIWRYLEATTSCVPARLGHTSSHRVSDAPGLLLLLVPQSESELL
jgi:hypothetical protein